MSPRHYFPRSPPPTMSTKIGYGIVTCDREDFFRQGDKDRITDHVDHFVVVNDGREEYAASSYGRAPVVITHHGTPYQGVGASKNEALQRLLNDGCDYLFLQEDDVIVDPVVLEEYIKAFEVSGIHHFNFPLHGVANKTPAGVPIVKAIVPYMHSGQPLNLTFSTWCVGAFSFYTRHALETVGLMDEQFYNAVEHCEHTYRICRAGLHPPYHWFADVQGSEHYIEEIEFSNESSIIRRDAEAFDKVVLDGMKAFKAKYGFETSAIPSVPQTSFLPVLRRIAEGIHLPSDDIPEESAPFLPSTPAAKPMLEEALGAAVRLTEGMSSDTPQGRKDMAALREASEYFGTIL